MISVRGVRAWLTILRIWSITAPSRRCSGQSGAMRLSCLVASASVTSLGFETDSRSRTGLRSVLVSMTETFNIAFISGPRQSNWPTKASAKGTGHRSLTLMKREARAENAVEMSTTYQQLSTIATATKSESTVQGSSRNPASIRKDLLDGELRILSASIKSPEVQCRD